MFIQVLYKDPPELSLFRRSLSLNEEADIDESDDKSLLVNPACPARVMLEYIRKRCKLGTYAVFDLCDETGALKGLFKLPTWEYPTDYFIHRKAYNVIVFKTEGDKQLILPQVNRQSTMHKALQERVSRFLASGEPTEVQAAQTKLVGAAAAPAPVTKTKKRRARGSET